MDMLIEIFEHQKALHEKYKPIEETSEVGFGIVVDCGAFELNNRKWQALLKDFSHRVIEELMESAENYMVHTMSDSPGPILNAKYELIDALHFLVEYLIIIGVEPIHLVTPILTKREPYIKGEDILRYIHERQVVSNYESYKVYYHNVVFELGMASNLLKLRPWKDSHKMTDEDRYKMQMTRAFYALIALFKFVDVEPDHIYEMYVKKNSINHDRIKEGY